MKIRAYIAGLHNSCQMYLEHWHVSTLPLQRASVPGTFGTPDAFGTERNFYVYYSS